ncbi:MAG TPA: 16S rRNA (guanine(527)-N(7))-methyltransferase RsmG [Treponema sp.]|nr:16S rRNA (guanine(527)-N(7))-methyltransferase RsmG [Treponema sp.]
MNYLHEGLVQLGFDKDDFYGISHLPLDQIEFKMDLYIKALQEYNAKFDLINTDDYDQIVIRHILDSLSGAPLLAKQISVRNTGSTGHTGQGRPATPPCDGSNASVEGGNTGSITTADLGSGAGLPGIPLSAVFPQFNFVLVERMSKRCNFLEHCARLLQLKNVTVEENQAERLQQNRFDFCVFRAFRPLEKKMTHVLRRILKDGGKLLAYKAKASKIEEEMTALGKNMPTYKVESLVVPFLTENSQDEERERNLVIIDK